MRNEKRDISAACGQYEKRHINWRLRGVYSLFPDEGRNVIFFCCLWVGRKGESNGESKGHFRYFLMRDKKKYCSATSGEYEKRRLMKNKKIVEYFRYFLMRGEKM